jgi:hypothetical protein
MGSTLDLAVVTFLFRKTGTTVEPTQGWRTIDTGVELGAD